MLRNNETLIKIIKPIVRLRENHFAKSTSLFTYMFLVRFSAKLKKCPEQRLEIALICEVTKIIYLLTN